MGELYSYDFHVSFLVIAQTEYSSIADLRITTMRLYVTWNLRLYATLKLQNFSEQVQQKHTRKSVKGNMKKMFPYKNLLQGFPRNRNRKCPWLTLLVEDWSPVQAELVTCHPAHWGWDQQGSQWETKWSWAIRKDSRFGYLFFLAFHHP